MVRSEKLVLECMQLNLHKSKSATQQFILNNETDNIDRTLVQELHCCKSSLLGYPGTYRLDSNSDTVKTTIIVRSHDLSDFFDSKNTDYNTVTLHCCWYDCVHSFHDMLSPQEICHSKLGRGNGGVRDVSLGDGCYKLGTVIHELIHSIGVHHEQSRSDRDQYITIHWENIKKGGEHNFQKRKHVKNNLLLKYDYNSIMHYGSMSFSKDKRRGLKTITAKRKGVRLLPPREKMPTVSDIKKINLLYKCSF
ncbi:zinc metalloproteinase nas-4-like [Stegodyphus dumicola]|uniref:zinc metalloproteinase nas-4-like n=1 Tax=Stegodyphus dumicola TaxID=202533 RepID=UPI0015ABA51A|nr:zinc metalloproteinase nas-4-like [Stegodyphus dumicola]